MNIILNWFPPAFKKIPSPAMSVLKGYLNQYGYKSYVCYWNLILNDIVSQSTGVSSKLEANEFDVIVPMLPILLSEEKDKEKLDKLCAYYQAKLPQYFNLNKQSYYSQALYGYSTQLSERIREITNQLYVELKPQLVGVNISLLQLVGANIFSQLSKKNHPNVPIIAGGISNKNEAVALLDNFEFYDFAIWGEGENPLHQLCRAIQGEISFEDVPNLAYRKNGFVIANHRNKQFLPLNAIKPDFSDFFKFIKDSNTNIKQTLIPIESSRGCHWNKCKFCFLTEGYRNRSKDNLAIIDEITQSIEKYDIYEFVFLDNDVIFNDLEKFNNLLDLFIELKEKHEQFGIWNGEVVTKGLNAPIIKKMILAGFKSIQIGYEAICDNLLTKINKKNSFSSNLLFVKWSCEYGLNLQGLNIITGLLEENYQDIIISIRNLHFLRFFLNEKIKHEVIPLQIMKASRYYKTLEKQNVLQQWNSNPLYSLLPTDYIKKEHLFDLMFFSENNRDALWNNFEKIDKHYSINNYSYKLYLSENSLIHYVETLNGTVVSKLEFDIMDDCHWNILKFCNKEVKSFEQIIEFLNYQNNLNGKESVKIALTELNDESILYSSPDFSENITIINTDILL